MLIKPLITFFTKEKVISDNYDTAILIHIIGKVIKKITIVNVCLFCPAKSKEYKANAVYLLSLR